MSPEFVFKLLTLLRLLAFMLFVYLGFGLLVERYSRKPNSQLKAFARTVCSPVTRPVGRLLAPGADHPRVLRVSMLVVAVIWAIVVIAGRAVRPG